MYWVESGYSSCACIVILRLWSSTRSEASQICRLSPRDLVISDDTNRLLMLTAFALPPVYPLGFWFYCFFVLFSFRFKVSVFFLHSIVARFQIVLASIRVRYVSAAGFCSASRRHQDLIIKHCNNTIFRIYLRISLCTGYLYLKMHSQQVSTWDLRLKTVYVHNFIQGLFRNLLQSARKYYG